MCTGWWSFTLEGRRTASANDQCKTKAPPGGGALARGNDYLLFFLFFVADFLFAEALFVFFAFFFLFAIARDGK
jgi:hypothetical protein